MSRQQIRSSLKRTFDGDPWHGPSVQAALDGVTASQASRRPIPTAHTIWELVKHMETWVQVVTQRLRGEMALEVPDEQDWQVMLNGLIHHNLYHAGQMCC